MPVLSSATLNLSVFLPVLAIENPESARPNAATARVRKFTSNAEGVFSSIQRNVLTQECADGEGSTFTTRGLEHRIMGCCHIVHDRLERCPPKHGSTGHRRAKLRICPTGVSAGPVLALSLNLVDQRVTPEPVCRELHCRCRPNFRMSESRSTFPMCLRNDRQNDG